MKQWYFLAGAIFSEVAASLSLKAAIDTPALYAVVAVGYTCAFAMLALALRQGMALGVAYGIWGALGVTLTALLSAVIFGEPLTAVMGVGIALVVAGVLTVEMGAEQAAAGVRAQAGPTTEGSTHGLDFTDSAHGSMEQGGTEGSALRGKEARS